jgi:hypothetical protein
VLDGDKFASQGLSEKSCEIRVPDYRKLLLTLPETPKLDRKNAAALFDYLLDNSLSSVINGGWERHLIVIDALDEAGEAGRDLLVAMLARNAQRPPDCLGLVVTSRPEFDVTIPLQALNPLTLDTQSESNRADICADLASECAAALIKSTQATNPLRARQTRSLSAQKLFRSV